MTSLLFKAHYLETNSTYERRSPDDETSAEQNLFLILDQTIHADQEYVNQQFYQYYLRYFKELPSHFIEGNTRCNELFHYHYGIIKKLGMNKYYLGLTPKSVEVIKNSVHLEGIKYPATLLFRKKNISYKKIIQITTWVFYKSYPMFRNYVTNEQIIGNNFRKYFRIIKNHESKLLIP